MAFDMEPTEHSTMHQLFFVKAVRNVQMVAQSFNHDMQQKLLGIFEKDNSYIVISWQSNHYLLQTCKLALESSQICCY